MTPDPTGSPAFADLQRAIGYDLLGPVLHRYCLGLHQFIQFLDDGDTHFLLCARAGLRIGKLYEAFLAGLPGEQPNRADLFWISRVAACKGLYRRSPARVADIIAREYHGRLLSDVVTGMLRHHPERLALLDLEPSALKTESGLFATWLQGPSPDAEALRTYFLETSEAFETYFDELTGGASRVVLIDNGWQGTTQTLFADAMPDRSFMGLYFGRFYLPGADRSQQADAIGLMFEQDTVDPAVPESAFIAHRHLIEALLEPNGPSIEEPPAGPFAAVAEAQIEACRGDVPTPEKDALYLHVLDYLNDNAGLGFSEVLARHQKAMPQLARMILLPTRDEALALAMKPRSADFGKTFVVPTLVTEWSDPDETSEARIRNALWTQGQIALETEGKTRLDLQERVTGSTTVRDTFKNIGLPLAERVEAAAAARRRSLVAIITRTKDRPTLLRRAARSVAAQTYPHYVWVVVNDGGDETVVREVVQSCAVDQRRIIVINHPKSLGMEAASNVGIRAAPADYLLIHDDDDSLDPTFLARTVAFLESDKGERYGGVITHSTYISEVIRGEQVIERSRTPYMDWVRHVQLAEMACSNFFPPIAFIYRREHWETVGGYNESLPVLGDWYFNLEFLLHADIGVIPEPLANYHHRDVGGSPEAYLNSVVGGRSKHEEFYSIARNEILRHHGNDVLATAVLTAHGTHDTRMRLGQVSSAVGELARDVTVEAKELAVELDRVWAISQINNALHQLEREDHLSTRASWWQIIETTRLFGIPLHPHGYFNEVRYLSENMDVASAVREGTCASGFHHYVLYGSAEGRKRP
ncbi:glycosyltransferase [Acuticoccus sediminis]|uniref:glycosyltransferase n=1 Tax=Acuticoccus sediminis TaxID=2184697 RepID=UPI001CFD724B|nr:glycosyltransferase [Acuticoccus sediminis]